MKSIVPFLMAAGIMMLATEACKEKKQSEDILITQTETEQPQAPIRMNVDIRVSPVNWMGKSYSVTIRREPADSLSMVSDENGQKYVDNCVALTIERSDGTVLLRRSFTKNSFASYIDSDYKLHGILENIVYHDIQDNELAFAVIVSHPDADDEFIPLELKINAQGGMSVKRGNLLEDEIHHNYDE